jgi:hypothetical protein
VLARRGRIRRYAAGGVGKSTRPSPPYVFFPCRIACCSVGGPTDVASRTGRARVRNQDGETRGGFPTIITGSQPGGLRGPTTPSRVPRKKLAIAKSLKADKIAIRLLQCVLHLTGKFRTPMKKLGYIHTSIRAVAYPGNSQGGHIRGRKKLTTFFLLTSIRASVSQRGGGHLGICPSTSFLLFFKPSKIIFRQPRGGGGPWPLAPLGTPLHSRNQFHVGHAHYPSASVDPS